MVIKKHFAFSLAETMILLTILAIAVAVSTPMISRKMVNSTESGTTLSGGSHGRYEIFSKEIISFDTDSWEKTINPDGSGLGKTSGIVVFKRLDDAEFYEVKHTVSKLSSDGKYKETLYEQIDNAAPKRNSNGEIVSVEYRNGGNTYQYPVGGKIIVENADIQYSAGCLDATKSPVDFIPKGSPKCMIATKDMPNDDRRIIEGNLVEKHSRHPVTNNKLWYLGVDSTLNYSGQVTSIPWERLYSGNKLSIDRPIAPTEGEYIGTFSPGENAKNVVLHAVGGGGAGGGLGEVGSAISPMGKSATSPEIVQLANDLTKRFNEINGDNKTSNEVVKIITNKSVYNSNYNDSFGGKYIIINTYDGTISGKIDVNTLSPKGTYYKVFPHEILNYTKILGAGTQKAITYNMPIWSTITTITNADYRAGIGACGKGGGSVPDYIINSGSDPGLRCRHEAYCSVENSYEPGTCCVGSGCCCGKDAYGKCKSYKCCCSQTVEKKYNNCKCTCSGRYTAFPKKLEGCPTASACDIKNCSEWAGGSCLHQVINGKGAGGGDCRHACVKITGRVNVSITPYGGDGTAGSANPDYVNYGGSVTLKGAQSGKSYIMSAVDVNSNTYNSAFSEGGGGGQPCSQTSFEDLKIDGKNLTMGELNVGIHVPNYAEGVFGVSSGDLAIIAGGISVAGNGNYTGTHLTGNAATEAASYMDSLSSRIAGLDFSLLTTTSENTAACDLMGSKMCGSSYKCGRDGVKGKESAYNSECDGADTGILTDGKVYNHVYTWTVPYRYNQLTFGEAGAAGEYKTTKISKVSAPLTIKLGQGGVWDSSDKWMTSKKGLKGSETTVKMGGKVILTANGGLGGTQSRKTNKYDLCYPIDEALFGRPALTSGIKQGIEDGICRNASGEQISCCYKEIGTRATKDIVSTTITPSLFDNIKALAGNSRIIGIGLGRGGEGAGTRSGLEEVGIDRYFYNASYGHGSVELLKDSRTTVSGSYDNKAVKPSNLNFKGGDGAVIITW